MVTCDTWFCVENRKKRIKTHPNTKILSIFKGRNNNLAILKIDKEHIEQFEVQEIYGI